MIFQILYAHEILPSSEVAKYEFARWSSSFYKWKTGIESFLPNLGTLALLLVIFYVSPLPGVSH